MRKGQIKLLEQAERNGLNAEQIELLMREDTTLAKLNDMFYIIIRCKDKPIDWIKELIQFSDQSLAYFIIYNLSDICASELKNINTREKLCEYISNDDIKCNNLFEVELYLSFKNNNHSKELYNFFFSVLEKNGVDTAKYDFIEEHRLIGIAEELSKHTGIINDLSDFLEGIDTKKLYYEGISYIIDYSAKFMYDHAPFKIAACKNIPEDITKLMTIGYEMNIRCNGFLTDVTTDLKGIFVTYSPYYAIQISSGNIYPKIDYKKEKKLLFFYDTQKFIISYNSSKGTKYKPALIRDIFDIISVGEVDENSESIINYLCQRYQTYLFRDLYNDYKQSNGLLLPLTIEETAQYHTKQELFEKHYKIPFKGKWNKKNSNLPYLLLKLHARLTAQAFARAMQCKKSPQIIHVGRQRYRMAFILYNAVNDTDVLNSNLLRDAVKEEYDLKEISLLSITRTVNAHNERQANERLKQKKKIKVRINKKTKFKKLIAAMPDKYELIQTAERLTQEAISQHNCVESYAGYITNDKCMIYSIVYNNERHTIEIRKRNNSYVLSQCYKSCNKPPNSKLMKELKLELKAING